MLLFGGGMGFSVRLPEPGIELTRNWRSILENDLAHLAALRANEMSQHRPFFHLDIGHWMLDIGHSVRREDFQYPTSNTQFPMIK